MPKPWKHYKKPKFLFRPKLYMSVADTAIHLQ